MVPIVLHRAAASPLPLHMPVAIALPRLLQGGVGSIRTGTHHWLLRLRPRIDAVGNGPQEHLRFRSRLSRCDLAHLPYFDPDGPSLSLLPKIALDHEGFGAGTDEKKEAGHILVSDDMLARRGERQSADRSIRERKSGVRHSVRTVLERRLQANESESRGSPSYARAAEMQ